MAESVSSEGMNLVDPARFPAKQSRAFLWTCLALLCVNSFCMLYRYGQLPLAPVLGDEVIINDPAVSLSRGLGLRALSFQNSAYGIDKLYAHFPPVYLFLESLAFRGMGVSVYSLRLVTTFNTIVTTAVFLLLLWLLLRRRVIGFRAGILTACILATDASLIGMQRIARMESTLEALALLGLMFVLLAATNAKPEGRRSALLIFAGAMFSGCSVAVHPEAVTAILPAILLILFAVPVTLRSKLLALTVLVATPAAIWLGIYGAHWRQALDQMSSIARYNSDAPGMGGLFKGLMLTTRPSGNTVLHDLLLIACMIALAITVLCVVADFGNARATDDRSSTVYRILRCFAVAALLDLALLQWAIPASAARLQGMLPVFLISFAVALGEARSRWLTVAAVLWISIQAGTLAAYFHAHPQDAAANPPSRFQQAIESVPRSYRIGATADFWLDLQQDNRPFAVFYDGFDGYDSWHARDGNPFAQFDAVLIEGAQCSMGQCVQYLNQGRTRVDFAAGTDHVAVYVRKPSNK